MKGHFIINTPVPGNPPFILRINGDKVDLRSSQNKPLELTWITERPAELEFSLADAKLEGDALAALRHYVYPQWVVDIYHPVKA